MLMKKMLRDARRNFRQFAAIFLLSALAMYMFTLFRSSDLGAYDALEQFKEASSFPSIWVYGESFDDKDEEAVLALPEVTEVQRRTELSAETRAQDQAQVDLYLEDENILSKPYVIDGDPFDPDDADRLWVNTQFAEAWDLSVGDTLSIKVNGETVTREIGGLILSPEYIYMKAAKDVDTDFHSIAYVYMGKEDFPNTDYIPYTQLLFRTDSKDPLALENKVSDALDGNYAVFIDSDNISGYKIFEDEIFQHEQFSYIFAGIFVIVSLLLIMVTMRRIVDAQRTQIGTMNAIGVSRGKIRLHYMSFSFVVSLAGGLTGLLLGPPTGGQYLTNIFMEWYRMPSWGVVYNDPRAVAILIAMVVLCTLMAFLSCRRLLRVHPAEALRPAPPKNAKRTLFEHLPNWDRLRFATQYNLRDIARSKLRTLMGIVGILFGMMLMVCAFSCDTTIDETRDWNFSRLVHYDNMLVLDETLSSEDAESLSEDLDGELIMSAGIEVAAGTEDHKENKKNSTLTVTEGKGLFGITDADLNPAEIPDGTVAVTNRLARQLGVKEGDTVYWHIYDKNDWHEATVGLINRNPTATGVTILRKDLEQEDVDFSPSRLLTDADVTLEELNKEKDRVTAVNNKQAMIDSFDTSMEIVNVMVYIFVIMSVLFVVLVLFNAGSLSFMERKKEFATLKVMGLSDRRIRGLMTQQNLWITVVGALIGTPFGQVLLQYMLDSNGDNFDYKVIISWSDYLLSFLLILLTSYLVTLLFSRRIHKLDMVETLKGLE